MGYRHKIGAGKALASGCGRHRRRPRRSRPLATRRRDCGLPPPFHAPTIQGCMHRLRCPPGSTPSRPAGPFRGLQARRARGRHRRRRRRVPLRAAPLSPPRLQRRVRRAPDVPAGRRAPLRGLEDPGPQRPAVREAVRGGDQPPGHGGVRRQPLHGLDRKPGHRAPQARLRPAAHRRAVPGAAAPAGRDRPHHLRR